MEHAACLLVQGATLDMIFLHIQAVLNWRLETK